MPKYVLFCLIGLSVAASSARSESSPKISVSIPHVTADGPGIDTLEIRLSSTVPVAGFDLKLASTRNSVIITDVIPGPLLDSCKWEVFNKRQLTLTGVQSSGVTPAWQFSALPELFPDSVKPICYLLSQPGVICRLVVRIAQDPHHMNDSDSDTSGFIRFLWEDCTDNTISGEQGSILYLSTSVDSMHTGQVSTTGPPPDCITPRRANRVKSAVTFTPGGIFVRNGDADSTSLPSDGD